MLFIHVESGRYPVGETEVRYRLHGIELPLQTEWDSFREHGYVGVIPSVKPISQEGFIVRESKPDLMDNGSYVQRWHLVCIDYMDFDARAAAVKRIEAGVRNHLSEQAAQRGYDSIESAVSYSHSKHQAWRMEGEAFSVWRDAVWLKALPELDEIKHGVKPVPMQHDFISSLPKMAGA